jgi:hypothetical protein
MTVFAPEPMIAIRLAAAPGSVRSKLDVASSRMHAIAAKTTGAEVVSMGWVEGVRPRDSRFCTLAAVSQAKGMTTAATVASTIAVIRMYSRRDVVKVFSIGVRSAA